MVDLQSDDKKVTATAVAKMRGKDISGTGSFTEYDVDGAKYVRLVLEVKGDPAVLKPGKHAVHIHEKADCDCDDFKCAGGHFDPGPAGNTDPDANHGFHAGDLPQLIVDSEGNGRLEALTTRVTLSPGPTSILDTPDGTSLMIHANPDPHTPGETGSGHSGGPRLSCGSIEKA